MSYRQTNKVGRDKGHISPRSGARDQISRIVLIEMGQLARAILREKPMTRLYYVTL